MTNPLLLLTSVPAIGDLALLILRLVIGVMFLLSGYFKLVDPDRRHKMESSLEQAKQPKPKAEAPVLSAVELVCGFLLVVGLFTALGAVVLLILSMVAFVTVIAPETEGEGIHKFENLIYTPEALIMAGLLVLIAIGAGGWSFDRALFY